MCHTGDILCVNREDNMQLRKTYIWVPLCQLPSKPQSFSKMQLCPLMSPKCQWRSNSNAPIKQMIVLTVFSMGISLKWVSNMGYSLYLVDPYESLLHAMVKKKKWPEDRNTPKIPPGPLSASQFWLLLHEIVVSQCTCMHTRTLVKGYRSLRELSKVWVMWFFQHGHFNLSYPSDYKQ